jgi:hypothetical protein
MAGSAPEHAAQLEENDHRQDEKNQCYRVDFAVHCQSFRDSASTR